MKKTILCLMFIGGFLANTAIAQDNAEITKETSESFCKKLAQAIVDNDQAALNSYYPTAQEFIDYVVSSGQPIDKIDIDPLKEQMKAGFKVYQSQMQGLRQALESQGFKWDKAKVDSVKTERMVETTESDGYTKSIVSYEIELNFITDDRQLFILSEKVFESSNGFRILGISTWEINKY